MHLGCCLRDSIKNQISSKYVINGSDSKTYNQANDQIDLERKYPFTDNHIPQTNYLRKNCISVITLTFHQKT